MTFAEVVEKTDLQLATKIFSEIAGQDFESKLSFNDWLAVVKIIQKKYKDDPLIADDIVLKRLVPLACTYPEWKIILNQIGHGGIYYGKERANIFDSMFLSIVSLDECKEFMGFFGTSLGYPQLPERFELALPEKAYMLATTFSDWLWVYSLPKKSKKVQDLCIQNMERLANTFEEWFSLYKLVKPEEDIGIRVFQKLVELAK